MSLARRAARTLTGLLTLLLPADRRDWARALAAEIEAIDDDAAAFGFAWSAVIGTAANSLANREIDMSLMQSLARRPRIVAACSAAGAVGLGMSYMIAGGAPLRYLLINGAALAVGLVTLRLLLLAGPASERARGGIALALAGVLLLTGLFGISAEGITRWVQAGGIFIQPSLLILPVLVLTIAGSRGPIPILAAIVAAAAFALQPDRAMASALAATMVVLAFARRDRNTLIAAAAALAASLAAFVRPDPSPAMPYVDQIFVSAFDVGPLAGLAVWSGTLLLLAPTVLGLLGGGRDRLPHALFGTVWLVLVAAAFFGNFPTPLVGYGGSAIIGYLVGLIGLPAAADRTANDAAPGQPPARDTRRLLRTVPA